MSKTLLSSVVAQLVIISLLGDATPTSAAAVVSASAARHRRQLSGSADQVDEARQDGPTRSVLVRAWLRAAAARAAADRQRQYINDDETEAWKRHLDDDDVFLVRRRMAWNSDDNDLDFLRRNPVSSSQCLDVFHTHTALTLYGQSNEPLYSNTVIGTLATDGWTATFGTACRGLGRLPSLLYQM